MRNTSTGMARGWKALLTETPILGPVTRQLARSRPVAALRRQLAFRGSSAYWEERYRNGGTSGAGSYGRLAAFKAEVLNEFVARAGIRSVVEFGCGDGAQLALARYKRYVGLDVSATSVALCRARFAGDPGKTFHLASELPLHYGTFDLGLSLDVIYHLVEDPVFDAYMRQLFQRSTRYVVIYASDTAHPTDTPHVRHRNFTGWIDQHAREWTLAERIENRYPYDPAQPEETSFADFYIYRR